MNDLEKQKMMMYEEIITFLRENRVVTSGLPGLNGNINRLYRILDVIGEQDKVVSSETLKKTLKLNELRDILIIHLLPLISALFRLARENNDILLKERTKLSRSNLVLYKNYELINKARLMSSLGEKNIKQISRFGIKNSDLIRLKQEIEQFQLIATDNGAGPETAVYALDQLFTQADAFILNIDEIIENHVEDELFYEEYQWVKTQEYEEEEDEKENLLFEIEET